MKTTTMVLEGLSDATRPPLDLFQGDDVFTTHRARLDEINAAEDTFTERERQRHAEYVQAVAAWQSEAQAAALAGTAPPPGGPQWEPSPGGEVFARERDRVRQDIAATWVQHRAEIVGRHLVTARAEADVATEAHAEAVAAVKRAEDRLHAAVTRVEALQRALPTSPERPEPVPGDPWSTRPDMLRHEPRRYPRAISFADVPDDGPRGFLPRR